MFKFKNLSVRVLCHWLLIFLFAPFWLTACEEKAPPPGTVASVNGEHISLHSVQTLMDSRSVALGIPATPSVAEMQERYSNALAVLIAYTLVRQDLASKGIEVSPKEVDEAIAKIKTDYGEGKLEEFLAQAYLREDDWRRLMRDYLSLEVFTKRVLMPSIRISLDEMRDYYQKHVGDLKTPENWQICLYAGESREDVEAWCKALSPETGSDAQTECLAVPTADVPTPWQTEIRKMKPLTCGKILEVDEEWRTVALIAKNAAKTRKLAELYPIIEKTLQKQKLAGAFTDWLTDKLAHADVKTSPELFRQSK